MILLAELRERWDNARWMEYELTIVTGASSGLGEGFAEALSGRTRRMVLVARRQERLEALAQRLGKLYPSTEFVSMRCDLAQASQRDELLARLTRLPPGRTLLINNAGLGDYGELAAAQIVKIRQLMEVNMLAVAELAHGLLPRLQRDGGDVVNIASLAADVFLPDFALYAASKSFVASFSEALRLELRGSGIRVLAVCPGPVHTEFGSVAKRDGYDCGDMPLKSCFYTSADAVIRSALRALEKGDARCYPSLKVWISGCLLRLLPLWLRRTILATRPRRVSIQSGKAS